MSRKQIQPEPGCTCQKTKTRRKRHLASCKLSQQGPVVAPIPGVVEPKPGQYHEMLRWVAEQVKAAGALLFIVNGLHGTGYEAMGDPALIIELPRLLRNVAADIERTAGLRKLTSDV
jgi:hypothetical protein